MNTGYEAYAAAVRANTAAYVPREIRSADRRGNRGWPVTIGRLDNALWRKSGGVRGLVRLEIAPTTPGMVVVAKSTDDWENRPELRFQVWDRDLEIDEDGDKK